MGNFDKCRRKIVLTLILCTIMCPLTSFSQNNIATKEFYRDNTLRREIILNDNLVVLSETYYNNSLPVAKIVYKSMNEIKSALFFKDDGITKEYLIDFEKGKYFDYLSGIELSFNGVYNFNGKQVGDKIISFYENGKRKGPILQFDSTITGKVLTNKVFVEYNYVNINGRMIITGKSLSPIYNDAFTLYKGAYLNFNDDLLDGESNVYYYNGNKKVQSNFNHGKCLNYSSFDNKGNLITRIRLNNGNLTGAAIINGNVKEFEGNNIVWFKQIEKTGSIYADYHPKNKIFSNNYPKYDPSVPLKDHREKRINYCEYLNFISPNNVLSKEKWNTRQLIIYKKDFDKNLSPADGTVIRLLLGIPYFYIHRYDFSNYSDEEFKIIGISKNAKIDSIGLYPEIHVINEDAHLYYEKNPFFTKEEYHTWDNIIYKIKEEDESNISQRDRHIFDNNDIITWLKSSYKYPMTGGEDYFLEDPTSESLMQNHNNSIINFLKSYYQSILYNCSVLNKEGTISNTNFKNPLFKTDINFIHYNHTTNDSLFIIKNEDGSIKFFTHITKDLSYYLADTLCFSLYDKNNGLSYTISYPTTSYLTKKIKGITVNTRYDNSQFKIKDSWTFFIKDKYNNIYYKNTDGIESVNKIDEKIKVSLEKLSGIYNKTSNLQVE